MEVLLRWGLQMGFQLIPKSVTPSRIAENMQIFDFELTESEMASLASMEGAVLSGKICAEKIQISTDIGSS